MSALAFTNSGGGTNRGRRVLGRDPRRRLDAVAGEGEGAAVAADALLRAARERAASPAAIRAVKAAVAAATPLDAAAAESETAAFGATWGAPANRAALATAAKAIQGRARPSPSTAP